MLNNFRNLNSLLWSQGPRWLLFRVGYMLRRRTGYLRAQMPQYRWSDRPLAAWLKKNIPSTPQAYVEWRKQNAPIFFFNKIRLPENLPWNAQAAVVDADRILSGELNCFSHAWYQTGFPPIWHQDPVTGTTLDSQRHWSELSDDSDVDIKFIWEASRFTMVYTLVRAYGSSRDEKYAEAFWELVHAWAESNPPNTGPNWMDGQEAALRLMAWTFGFRAFLESPSTTPERVAQFVVMVAAHAERIYKNIDFALSTQSNHAVSEAFGLWMVGLLFPELTNAGKYLERGRTLLEQQAVAQIFPDGSYSMYSLNYHRFILHIYLYAIRLGELNKFSFSSQLKLRIASSIAYLSTFIDPETGQMPVYGSNDGALVLPLNTCDFTDYRPLLQLGSYITTKQLLFPPGPWDEDLFWLCQDQPVSRVPLATDQRAFPYGGTYLLHGLNSRAILRCTDYHSRPSHADQLHVDLWIRGQNIAIDAGTYLYSGEGMWRNGLSRTSVHNSVVVDGLDQMKMLTRFTWTNWSHGKVLRHTENFWQAEHDGYKRLADPVLHRRTVMSLGKDRWLVVDHLIASQPHHYALHWLLADGAYTVQEQSPANEVLLSPSAANPSDPRIRIRVGVVNSSGTFSIVRADSNSTRGWRSRYYGEKEPAISVLLETEHASSIFWSFFGFEDDLITLNANMLAVNSQEIDLTHLNK